MTRLLALGLAVVTCLVLPGPAHAQIVTSPLYGPGTVNVVTQDTTLLRAEHQFFSPTYRGLTELCQNLPHLCAEPRAQEALRALRAQHRRSLALTLGGGAVAVGGLATTIVFLSRAVGAESRPHRVGTAVGLGSLGAGVIAIVIGSAFEPGREDVRQTVNGINQAHPNDPVQWSWWLAPARGGAAATLAARF